MLRRETEFTYERKQGDTMYIIESISHPENREDIWDALIALMKRDIEDLGKQ